MAGVLEIVSIPRASALPSAALAPVSSGSHLSSVRFGGFKIQPSIKLNLNSKLASRGGVIVCEAQQASAEVSAVNDSTWKSSVLDCDSPALVEFWAPWCGPCRMFHPTIEKLAKEYSGKMKFYKVNTDECPSIATQLGIRSIPTILIYKDGEKKETLVGAVTEPQLTTCIEKFL